MSDYPVNIAITDTFSHYLLTTGLTNGSFTKLLYKDGVASGQTVTVTEISGGQYKASFTPNAEGVWFLLCYETATSSVKYLSTYPVRKVESDVIIESVGSYTIQQALSVLLAACAGVTTDSGATLKTPDGTTTRIAATLNSSNERTAITLTPSS